MSKVLISGASGFVGSSLVSFLEASGYKVVCLVRKGANTPKQIFWNPRDQHVDISKLEGFDSFINLSGENIASGYWTEHKKNNLLKSRIDTTKFLVSLIGKLKFKPKLFLCASAIGIYGSRGEDLLDESAVAGPGFLAKLAKAWENAAQIDALNSVRTVNLRIGLVIGASGGIIKNMLLPFKLGLGAILGDGKQYMSWIALADLLSAIDFIIKQPNLSGAINAVAPCPVTNADFSRALAKALKRPLFLRAPAPLLRLLLGEMAQELFLASTRCQPKRLLDGGFKFRFETLKACLEEICTERSGSIAIDRSL